MLGMTNTKKTSIIIPDAIKEAAGAWCVEHGVHLSEAMLEALCNHIGRPELVAAIRKRGRPKEQPAKPQKQRRS